MPTVALVKGNSRKNNIAAVLQLIENDIRLKQKVIIKPNFVSDTKQLASTHVDAAEAVIEFFEDTGVNKFYVAESSAHDTATAFKNFHYEQLKESHNVLLVDLDKHKFEHITLGYLPKPVTVQVSTALLDKRNFIVSLALLKTHDSVVATLSVKNVLMGSVYNKGTMHQGYKEINNYLALLAERVWPDLAVIDGFIGMEGNGPTHGMPVDSRVAIASTDALAADWVGLQCMGVAPEDVGYLSLIAKKGMGSYGRGIEIAGSSIEECRKKYRLHDAVKEQIKGWKV